jgi:hypothetical protein
LYGLKQAPRAWYERLRDFLLSKGFKMGKVDTTLFTKNIGIDLFVLQIYVLRLQIKQMNNDTFVSQGKYIKDMIKKFGFQDAKSMSTPMGTND